jgi:hypothetical protein
VAQFGPESLAQFGPDLVAQFDRNIHLVHRLKSSTSLAAKKSIYKP